MTNEQLEMLHRLNLHHGPYGPIEYNFKSKTRMLDRLVKLGLASEYVHGGYEITEAGRAALNPTREPDNAV
jgi:hypothetical protein